MFYINKKLLVSDVEQLMHSKAEVLLSKEAEERIVACRNFLDNKIGAEDIAYYGINTGFGWLCNTKISNSELSQLQENLLLSHACGTGLHVPQEIVKLMLLLKVQSLAYGYSGVQLKTVNRLLDFYNHEILPVVYTQGSLGASGDLAPLAHLCLPLLGYGEVWVKQHNEWVIKSAKTVLKEKNWEPIVLQSKEGLALINGTQFMSAYAVYTILQAEKLYKHANMLAALSVDAFDARPDPFNMLLHSIRPHKGQVYTAAQVLNWLEGSEIVAQPKMQVQDPYAFRCVPQVHGATYDTITHVKHVIETEINSVTDNPNVFVKEDLILSGGNFHGQPLALVLDFLAIAVAELGSISERRTYQLISGQRNLPAFLIAKPGLNSGLMITQYTAAGIVSENKQLCTPASVDSIISSNGQEDHVSMGANAATKCYIVVNNVKTILAIELLNASQALYFRAPYKTSQKLQQVLSNYRQLVPQITNDRYLHDDIKKSVEYLDQL